ncbi:Mevalonate kinase [Marinobacterium lacunae]|uniref:mevalonate kinase n=1 Tax=Marinobacterium lacunae TaxID=1232683 RepID=A0A081FXC9_9GAMM|nr:mevalonate kinase [Marinobacterium lacunae]KEA63184.1 Mevalonate kinase [Marinobacterium lacunae]MBR9885471.1 mevalonate kinase [Oceanospirillales bacterium]
MRVACAPGKVILSGEHAVVYGAPALALAVDRHMRVYYQSDRLPRLSWHAQERTHVLGLDKFAALRRRLDSHFERYLRGELSITQILKKPAELAFYAVDMARMVSGLDSIPRGSVRIDSDIPIGAGMGSSAALIAALLTLFGHFDDLDQLIQKVHHCERLQHGRGSLIDAATVCSGGLVRLRDGQISRPALAEQGLGEGWFWVFTGTPAASTGTCVERVRRAFSGSVIWSEFADVTTEIELRLGSGAPLAEMIRQNHRLLTRIGVVPATLVRFAEQVERRGGAAKVAGAGSVSGESGGLMLVWLPEGTPSTLEMPGDWHWGELKEDPAGVRLLDDQG